MKTIKLIAGGLLIFAGVDGLLVNIEQLLAGRLRISFLIGSVLATALFVWLGKMLFSSGIASGGTRDETFVSNQRIGLRLVKWGVWAVGFAVILVILFKTAPLSQPPARIFTFTGKLTSVGLFAAVLGKVICLASSNRSDRPLILVACACVFVIYLLAGFGSGSIFRALPHIRSIWQLRLIAAGILGIVAFGSFAFYLRALVRPGETTEVLRRKILIWMLSTFLVGPTMLVGYWLFSFLVGKVFSFDPEMAITGGALFSLIPFGCHLGWFMRLVKEIAAGLQPPSMTE